jgi:hypothetical protein
MWTQFFTHDAFLQTAGIAGFICYIIGFAGVQLGYIDGNSSTYTLWSLSGASLVLISLLGAFNLASMLIQISWIIIGITGLVRRALNRSRNLVKTPETRGLFTCSHTNTSPFQHLEKASPLKE